MIWTGALVRHRIYITWNICESTLQDAHTRTCYRLSLLDWDCGNTHNGSGTYVGVQKQPQDWLSMIMAFSQGSDTSLDDDNNQPYLNALLLCRQAYDEAAPIFYSQNCFVFCATEMLQSGALESSGLPPAYAFLKDRSAYTLQMIKRIEIQLLDHRLYDGVAGEPRSYPLSTVGTDSMQSYRHTDLFTLLKANVSLDYLGLYIAGWSVSQELPDKAIFDRNNVPALESLCNLRQVNRLALNYVTRTSLVNFEHVAPVNRRDSPIRCHIHPGHGLQCYLKAANEAIPYDHDWELTDCGLAHESLRAAAFARLLRHHILKNGKDKGYQDINVVTGMRDDMPYLMLSTDDDKSGRSHLGDVHGQPQQKSTNNITAEINTFAMVGDSGLLDQLEPQRWTPHWSTEEK